MARMYLAGERVAGGFRFHCPRCGMNRVAQHQTEHHYCEVSEPLKQQPRAAPHGPGTELKKLLAQVGITASPTCSCNARARTMDANGCEWCEDHLDEIVGWLREEAGKRGLPFLDAAGRLLVRRAISRARAIAREAENSRSQEG